MKFLKRLLLTLLIIYLSWHFFGAAIYRAAVSYEKIGDRKQYTVTNKELEKYIDEELEENRPPIEEVIKQSVELTSDKLKFTFLYCDTDPNELVNSEKANCVGYAAFTASVCNYLIKKYKNEPEWKARPIKGQLFLFGSNMHNWFSSSFFKDHDFVIIENSKTMEKYFIDPTASDYLGVDFVKARK